MIVEQPTPGTAAAKLNRVPLAGVAGKGSDDPRAGVGGDALTAAGDAPWAGDAIGDGLADGLGEASGDGGGDGVGDAVGDRVGDAVGDGVAAGRAGDDEADVEGEAEAAVVLGDRPGESVLAPTKQLSANSA